MCSHSQASSSPASRPSPMAPHGSAAATAGMRRWRPGDGSGGGSSAFGVGGNGSNILKFYMDDAPGLKITPTVVLIMSLYFISFVAALHVFGKLCRYRSGVGA